MGRRELRKWIKTTDFETSKYDRSGNIVPALPNSVTLKNVNTPTDFIIKYSIRNAVCETE